ncbi:MAG TPA: DUF5666 domain-containing protein [Chloroflexota bacterium]|jgi:hypothetical protein|nr:DUF5666 domain-containing protein [Chloroflexota bacterium]
MIGKEPSVTLGREEHNGTNAAVALPPAAATEVPPRPRRRPNRLVLVGGALGCGLLLGALAAVASAPLRHTPAVVVTPVQGAAGGASGGAGAAAAARGDDPSAAQGPGGPAGATRGASTRSSSGASTRAQGVISQVEGDTITVNGPEGPVQVRLGDATAVQQLVPADRAALAPGQRVVVAGERAADGTLSATSVQIVGEGTPASAERRSSAAP